MNIIQIYEQYTIPKNLQLHMMRVTSIAKIILDNWTGPKLDADAVIKACLFHDIAKPMTFDLTKQIKFGMTEIEVENIKKTKHELQTKYGHDEYTVTRAICKKLNCAENTLRILEHLSWSHVPELLEKSDSESLILIYADMRISPHGVFSLKERLKDLQARTGEDFHEKNGMDVEKVIRENVSINLNEISEEDLKRNFSALESVSF